MKKGFLGSTLGLLLLVPVLASADTINFLVTYSGSGTDKLTGSDGTSNGLSSTVSATATFSYDVTTSQLLIALSNTTLQANLLGHNDTLTQIAFRLSPSLSVTGGSAMGQVDTWAGPGAGTFSLFQAASPNNENAQWGGGVLTGYGAPAEFTLLSGANDNVAVTSLTDELLTTGGSFKSFAGSSLDNLTNYGVIPAVTGPAVADNFIGFNRYTYGTVYLALNVTGGAVTAGDLSGINFIFGDSDPPNAIVPGTVVPEPATMFLGGLGLIVFGVAARRRLFGR